MRNFCEGRCVRQFGAQSCPGCGGLWRSTLPELQGSNMAQAEVREDFGTASKVGDYVISNGDGYIIYKYA